MVGTGLSETPAVYRTKLVAQDDAQIDAWVAGSLRDIAKRRGVVQSVHELGKATGLDDDALAGAFTLGGGAAACMGVLRRDSHCLRRHPGLTDRADGAGAARERDRVQRTERRGGEPIRDRVPRSVPRATVGC